MASPVSRALAVLTKDTRRPDRCKPVRWRLYSALAREIGERDVAQSGSAPEWGSGGRGFKSRRPDSLRFAEQSVPSGCRKRRSFHSRLIVKSHRRCASRGTRTSAGRSRDGRTTTSAGRRGQARRFERGATVESSRKTEPRRGSRYTPLLAALQQGNEQPNLALEDPHSGTWAIVRQADIEWISADASSRVLVHVGDSAYRWRKTLAGVAEMLDPHVFVRVHRSYIVNVNHIRQVKSLTKGEFMIQLASGQTMDTGRTYRDAIDRFLLGATHASSASEPVG